MWHVPPHTMDVLHPTHPWLQKMLSGELRTKTNLASKCAWFLLELQHFILSSFLPLGRYDQDRSEILNDVPKCKRPCQRVTGLCWGSTLPLIRCVVLHTHLTSLSPNFLNLHNSTAQLWELKFMVNILYREELNAVFPVVKIWTTIPATYLDTIY